MKKPLVIKIGGAILEKQLALTKLLSVIANITEADPEQAVVLVHGGGCIVDQMLAQAGFSTSKKDGLRITPKEQMPLITGALAGAVNKSIVANALSMKINAVGLSLADGAMISCQLSPLNLGAVGEASANKSLLLDTLLNAHFLPVICSIGCLVDGQLVNVNADDAAVAICQLLDAQLLLLTDVNGVNDANGNTIPSLNKQQAQELINQGTIKGGMTAKVQAALRAANSLRRTIAVASWQSPEQLINLLNGDHIGTRMQPDASLI
jgi:acetylglutamate kinase